MGTPRQPSTIGHDAPHKKCMLLPEKESSNLQKKKKERKGEEEVENSSRAEGLSGVKLAPWRVSDGLLNVSSDEVKDVSLCLWPGFNQAPAGPSGTSRGFTNA